MRRKIEKAFGKTLEELAANREKDVAALRRLFDPVRASLRSQPFISGSQPAYADYIVFSPLQWARIVARSRSSSRATRWRHGASACSIFTPDLDARRRRGRRRWSGRRRCAIASGGLRAEPARRSPWSVLALPPHLRGPASRARSSLAAGFRGSDLGPGDIVAAQLPNSVEFLACYLATGYIGATLADHPHAVSRRRGGNAARAQPRRRGGVSCAGQGRLAGRDHPVAQAKAAAPQARHRGRAAAAGRKRSRSRRSRRRRRRIRAAAPSPRRIVSCCSTRRARPRHQKACRSITPLSVQRGAQRRRARDRSLLDPALRRAVTPISTACSRSISRSPPAPRPRSCRRSRRRRSPPRSTHVVRPGCSSRPRTCRPA